MSGVTGEQSLSASPDDLPGTAATAEESQVKILLVDDRADKLLALETALESLGQTLVKVSSGEEALRALLVSDFAVILLDVSMPGMDGFETASLIRHRARSEHTPIIFVTSVSVHETHVSKGYSLGAVDYIFSPIEPEILRSKVAVFIDLHKKSEQIKKQTELLRLAAEQRAEDLENRLEGLMNRLNVGVFRANLDGKLLEGNPALLRLFQLSSISEFNEQELWQRIDTTAVLHNAMVTPQAFDIEWFYPDGKSAWFHILLSRSEVSEGDSYIDGIIDDISDRKKGEKLLRDMNEHLEERVRERSAALKLSQQHLRRSERLASLGTLAAGIAHEINNPLNSILMASEYARRNFSDKETVNRSLENISEHTRRCGRIIKGVLQFARDQKATKGIYDLNEVVRAATDLMRTYVRTPLRIDFDLESNLPAVCVNQTEIEQVIINLLQNAAQAAEEATLEVLLQTRRSVEQVELSIKDNGPGISKEIIDKIFDPFFSTRINRGGTGLGLSVAHGIITEHGGLLKVVSEPGNGAEFIIALPFAEE